MFANFVTESFIVVLLFGKPREGNTPKKVRRNIPGEKEKLLQFFFQRTEGKRYSADTGVERSIILQETQLTYQLTMWHFRGTIFAMEKQKCVLVVLWLITSLSRI